MLVKNPKLRIKADAALRHPWMIKRQSEFKKKDEQDRNLVQSLRKLKGFQSQNTLQKSVLSYVASHGMEANEEEKLRKIFSEMDDDKNGFITVEELAEVYNRMYQDNARAKKEALEAIKRIDINNNGVIDYNGTMHKL